MAKFFIFVPEKDLVSYHFIAHDTIHSGKAAYQISNHFCKWLLSFSGRKCMWTDGRTTVKLNAPDAYRQGHKNMVPIVPDKKIFFHRISNVELSSVLIVILV